MRVMPAVSGPGVSVDSGSRRGPVLKLKSSFLQPAPRPAISIGACPPQTVHKLCGLTKNLHLL